MECKACGRYITDHHGTVNRVYVGLVKKEGNDKSPYEILCENCMVNYFLMVSDADYWIKRREELGLNGTTRD